MHVPWNWIKQRPHFIAEGLSEYFDITVYYPKSYRTKKLIENPSNNRLQLKELFMLPFSRFKPVDILNKKIIRYQLQTNISKYETIWTTSPHFFDEMCSFVSKEIPVIYDCMDDILAFQSIKQNEFIYEEMFCKEKTLVERSNIIFVSSQNLKNKLIDRYKITSEKIIQVVNNGININEEVCANIPEPVKKALADLEEYKKIIYVGTISDWLDIDLILASLEAFQDISYIFVGPNDVSLPKHERIVCTGPVPHKCIFPVMREADALVMPFKVDELILSVNPVKVYEYIYSCRPSIVVGYPETAIFADYVHLYKTQEEYFSALRRVLFSSEDIDKEKHKSFAQSNTWSARTKQIELVVNLKDS